MGTATLQAIAATNIIAPATLRILYDLASLTDSKLSTSYITDGLYATTILVAFLWICELGVLTIMSFTNPLYLLTGLTVSAFMFPVVRPIPGFTVEKLTSAASSFIEPKSDPRRRRFQ